MQTYLTLPPSSCCYCVDRLAGSASVLRNTIPQRDSVLSVTVVICAIAIIAIIIVIANIIIIIINIIIMRG